MIHVMLMATRIDFLKEFLKETLTAHNVVQRFYICTLCPFQISTSDYFSVRNAKKCFR